MRFFLCNPWKAQFSPVAPCRQVRDIVIKNLWDHKGPFNRASALKAQLKAERMSVVPLISKIRLFVDSPYRMLVWNVLLTEGRMFKPQADPNSSV